MASIPTLSVPQPPGLMGQKRAREEGEDEAEGENDGEGEGDGTIGSVNDPEGVSKRQARLCIEPNCDKLSQGASGQCKAHGGGRRCEVLGCEKSAQGASGKCKVHGGGRRCNVEDCEKSAAGPSNLCDAHGGASMLTCERERLHNCIRLTVCNCLISHCL